MNDRRVVLLGHVSGAQGVSGWVKVYSLTEPRENILTYQRWLLGDARRQVRVLQGQRHGDRVIALLEGVEDRDGAEALAGQDIAVYRDELADLPPGRYYWDDLVGLSVSLEDGRELGRVERMMATGANDVLVVGGDRERLIPFVIGPYVKQVDLEAGRIVVDWDPDF